ncbi:MAG: adenosylcobinamide-GDP ribazoletransferase [Fervidobacterium sp.]
MILLKRTFEEIMLTLSFLTRIPIKIPHLNDWEIRIKNIPIYFPLIGYLPGLIYYTGAMLYRKYMHFGLLIQMLTISFGFYMFDLFHFDGLLDMFDGLLNQSNKEKRLEIMSKGNVGPFAVFYGTLYVLTFWELFKQIDPASFIFGSVFGRYTMDVVMFFSKPAKQTGLGALLYPFKKITILVSLFFTLPLFLTNVELYMISLTTAFIIGITISFVSLSLVGGITGDILGGSCLIGEMVILVLGYISN